MARIRPSRNLITYYPDPVFSGIRRTNQLTIGDYNVDISILSSSARRYLIRMPEQITSLQQTSYSGVFEAGLNYNFIMSDIWKGKVFERLRERAYACCVRILSGEAYVPEDSYMITRVPGPPSPDWNARTTGLFYTLGLFLVVMELKSRNLLTNFVVNYCYEKLTQVLDFPVDKAQLNLTAFRIYDNKRFNYSLLDITNQIMECDWIAMFWNNFLGDNDNDTMEHLYVWIKLLLCRAGDSRLKVKKDQVTVPSPFTRQCFKDFQPGEMIVREDFLNEVNRFTRKPFDLRPNTLGDVTYHYPSSVPPVWESDVNDKGNNKEMLDFAIVFTALYLTRTYSFARIYDLFPNHG